MGADGLPGIKRSSAQPTFRPWPSAIVTQISRHVREVVEAGRNGTYPCLNARTGLDEPNAVILLEASSIVASPEFGTNRIARPATNARRRTTTTL